jgi:hypothetical protein
MCGNQPFYRSTGRGGISAMKEKRFNFKYFCCPCCMPLAFEFSWGHENEHE